MDNAPTFILARPVTELSQIGGKRVSMLGGRPSHFDGGKEKEISINRQVAAEELDQLMMQQARFGLT